MHSALCRAGGLLKNLIDNLDGKNGEEWLEITRRVLRRQNPFAAPSLSPEPDFTLRFDQLPSEEQCIAQLGKICWTVWDKVEARLNSRRWFTFSRFSKEERVVVITPRQLGLGNEATSLPNLWVRAEEVGLGHCSESAALVALLQQLEWFKGKSVHFASAALDGRLWHIKSDDNNTQLGTRLGVSSSCMTMVIEPDDLWAFTL